MGLQKEVWVAGIKEQPIPDTLFIMASTDMSMYVDSNKVHLAEAGLEPAVHEDYFVGNETELPTATIADVPSEVVLRTYSTDQTRHRNLQDVELQYDKRASIIGRHRTALIKNLGLRTAYTWCPSVSNGFNKVVTLTANGAGSSVIDAIIDLQLFYADLDKSEGLNICLTPAHMASIRKENKTLYKEILGEKGGDLYGFKVYSYSNCPLFTSAGVKKPFGTALQAGDKRASFTWATDEVFRCFGDIEVYPTLGHSGLQADIISFAQRALIGNIRASNPKYLGAII
jgi:hypothetical protein